MQFLLHYFAWSMLCPCFSGKTYLECCAPYHRGIASPDAQALMRSRYSGYALGKVDYILKTTHPEHPDSKQPLSQRKKQIRVFCKETTFEGLDILDFTEEGDKATVTFHAHLSQNGKNISFKEKSEFVKLGPHWLYLSGTKLPIE